MTYEHTFAIIRILDETGVNAKVPLNKAKSKVFDSPVYRKHMETIPLSQWTPFGRMLGNEIERRYNKQKLESLA